MLLFYFFCCCFCLGTMLLAKPLHFKEPEVGTKAIGGWIFRNSSETDKTWLQSHRQSRGINSDVLLHRKVITVNNLRDKIWMFSSQRDGVLDDGLLKFPDFIITQYINVPKHHWVVHKEVQLSVNYTKHLGASQRAHWVKALALWPKFNLQQSHGWWSW